MVLFHVKAKTFSELSESAAMFFFSIVCVMLQALYTTAKEFRTIVFLIFDGSC